LGSVHVGISFDAGFEVEAEQAGYELVRCGTPEQQQQHSKKQSRNTLLAKAVSLARVIPCDKELLPGCRVFRVASS
jgi:hypothetical protein